jgi:hypothetical protein
LEPERWGSFLVQENYQEEKTCDKRQNNNILTIIRKEARKILKYKHFKIEIQCM